MMFDIIIIIIIIIIIVIIIIIIIIILRKRLHAVYKITKRCLPQLVACTNRLNTLHKRTG